MKTLRIYLFIAFVFGGMTASAQTDKATTARLVEAQNLVFTATSAIPMANAEVNAILNRMQNGSAAGLVQLNGTQYQLKVTKDSLQADLPYYGRAYTASMNPNDSGIKFKSKKFAYDTAKKKKSGWTINIKPQDTREVQSMVLSVSENGYASLSVNSNNRQTITFNGYISEPQLPKN